MMKKKSLHFNLYKKISSKIGKDIVLYFCSFIPVGLEDYVEFFRENFVDFVYMFLKFPHSRDNKIKSEINLFNNRKKIYSKKLFNFKPAPNKFIYFILLPLYYMFYLFQILIHFSQISNRHHSKFKLFMGVNYFCTLGGIFLKKIGKVDFVIYRVMDFFPLPPSGIYRLLNRIFYIIDRYCLKNADYLWFTTEGHIIGREKYGYFKRNKCARYLIIPLGINMQKFKVTSADKIDRFSLVYCGIVSKYHLLDTMIDVVKNLKNKYPQIVLNIIGTGPDDRYFKEKIKKMGMERNIVMHGFIPSGEEFNKIVSKSVLGFALYKDEENFMKYTEPAKVKTYLSLGVPVVVSDVPQIAKEVEKCKVGFCVTNNKNEILKIVDTFINNRELQTIYKNNIKEFAQKVDINYLLHEAFEKTFHLISL